MKQVCLNSDCICQKWTIQVTEYEHELNCDYCDFPMSEVPEDIQILSELVEWVRTHKRKMRIVRDNGRESIQHFSWEKDKWFHIRYL